MLLLTKAARYFATLSNGKRVLWCYMIWYANTVAHYFDPSPAIWLNSVGLSALIGAALILSVGAKPSVGAERWQTFRLFAMLFAVSSFWSLFKGKGFWLIFAPLLPELAWAVCLCALFVALVMGSRKLYR